MKRVTLILVTMPLAFVLYLALRLVDLFRPVRIGTLNAKGRMSIMVSYIEPYLRKLQVDGVQNPLVIVINPGACPNEQLTRMYKRVLWLLDDQQSWLRHVFTVTHRFFASRSRIGARLWSGHTREFARAWQADYPVLRFIEQEHKAGRLLLRKLGVPDGALYICFGLRDAAYYQQFLTAEAQARALYLNTEAGEDTYIRTPPLKNYIPMAAQCVERGLYVLRMGQIVGEPLPPRLHPNIIDYASRYRTPFGDVYLLAACKYVVAGGAALWWISSAFNRPVVWTDSYCLQVRPLRLGDLFIPKKLWLISDKRLLTFREMLDAGMRYSYESNCRRDGVELIHNTPDEIAAVVLEMDQRLNGTWQPSDEDEELQYRFNALYRPEHMGYGMPGRIGVEFLRQHADLL